MATTHARSAADLGDLRARAGEVSSLPQRQLLALQDEAIAARREVDLVLAHVAAEVARRSARDDGQPGLARREGFGSPQQLIATKAGGSTSEADRLMTVAAYWLTRKRRRCRQAQGQGGLRPIAWCIGSRWSRRSD